MTKTYSVFKQGSDIYLIESPTGFFQCLHCRLGHPVIRTKNFVVYAFQLYASENEEDSIQFSPTYKIYPDIKIYQRKMLSEHLQKHVDVGHNIPASVYDIFNN